MTAFRMEDLQPNPHKPAPDKLKSAPKRKKVVRRRKATTKQQATMPVRSKKELPRSSVSQPRDHLGRFARKTGAVLWGVAKGTARAVVGTARVAQKAHKAVSRAQSDARRRARLEEREQKFRKKKVIRRRK